MPHPFLQRRPLESNLPQRYQPGDALAQWHQRKAQQLSGGQPCEMCGADGRSPCRPNCSNVNRVPPPSQQGTKPTERFRNRMFFGPRTAQNSVPWRGMTDLSKADEQVAQDWLRDDALNVGTCETCGEEGPLQEFRGRDEEGPKSPIWVCKRCFAHESMSPYGDLAMQQSMEQMLRGGQRISPPEHGELDRNGWFEEKSVAGKTRWIRREGDFLLEVAQATEGQISLSMLDTSANKILWRKIERGVGGNAIERAKAALDDMLDMQSSQHMNAPHRQVAKVAHPVWDIQAGGTLTRKVPEKTAEEGEKDNEMPQAQPMMGFSASIYLSGREVKGSISKVASDGTVSLTTSDGEVLEGIAPEFLGWH